MKCIITTEFKIPRKSEDALNYLDPGNEVH